MFISSILIFVKDIKQKITSYAYNDFQKNTRLAADASFEDLMLARYFCMLIKRKTLKLIIICMLIKSLNHLDFQKNTHSICCYC